MKVHIIDFSSYSGQNIVLTNDAPVPFPNGDPVDPDTTGQIMQFRVTLPLSAADTSTIPPYLSSIRRLEQEPVHDVMYLTLDERTDRYGRLLMLLDGKKWGQPITEKPRFGSIEVWNLMNLTQDTHPIHLHLVHFQILNRQPFDVEYYKTSGQIRYTGPAVAPDPNEKGWKDTVRANPGQVTRIVARFGPYTGRYVWHCHIFEHEDYEMMHPYEVISAKEGRRRKKGRI